MTNINLNNYWMLTDVRGPFPSKSMHNKNFYVVEMTNCKSKEKLTTYATQGLGNYKNWLDCIDRQWGVYEGITPHNDKPGLINGDCIPRLVETCTEQEAKCFRNTGTI
jgi:hypothetical protein|tara:strand:+ start:1193 stop:1516 length:324 start_codon:yes stop_codon:yes gene_type:complete